jgi:hypothetical protein
VCIDHTNCLNAQAHTQQGSEYMPTPLLQRKFLLDRVGRLFLLYRIFLGGKYCSLAHLALKLSLADILYHSHLHPT